MHPCPCGYYGDATRECSCSATMVSKYQKRISGPMLDRIDIHVEVPRDLLGLDDMVRFAEFVRRWLSDRSGQAAT